MPRGVEELRIYRSMDDVDLNILGVIVLAEPSDDFCLDTPPNTAKTRGVNLPPMLREMGKDVGWNTNQDGKEEKF